MILQDNKQPQVIIHSQQVKSICREEERKTHLKNIRNTVSIDLA